MEGGPTGRCSRRRFASPLNARGVDVQTLGERIADVVVELMSISREKRPVWLAKQFGPDYPLDLADREVAVDLVAHVINDAPFSSAFRCPACGRVAFFEPESGMWTFFAPE